MSDILRTTVEDRIRMDRRARSLSRKCGACGLVFHRANLIRLKNGPKVCGDCLDQLVEASGR